MKRFIIAIAVVGIFILYSAGIRHQSPVIGKPSASVISPSTASSTTTPNTSINTNTSTSSQYKDGTYTGSVADAYYGNVQVAATISGGKITDVKFLQSPDTHQTSVIINQQAIPYLRQEAIQAQSANVQIISGATYTSQAFQQSLQSALSQA